MATILVHVRRLALIGLLVLLVACTPAPGAVETPAPAATDAAQPAATETAEPVETQEAEATESADPTEEPPPPDYDY